jgi:hypothetical protein
MLFVDKVLKRKFDGEDLQEDVISGLDYTLRLSWSARTRILIHIADDPCHNQEFHSIRGDRYATGLDPSGRGPKEMYELLGKIVNNEIEYHFFHLSDHTSQVCFD